MFLPRPRRWESVSKPARKPNTSMPRKPKSCATDFCGNLTNGSLCKPCDLSRRKSGIDRPAYARQWQLQRKYGIDLSGFDALWIAQRGLCGVCGVHLTMPSMRKGQSPTSASVDHNHHTGNIRGLLCNRCNMALGLLEDSEKLLKRALSWVT